MNYTLPTSQKLGGIEYEIRSDFRAVLDICAALNDPELSDREKAEVALMIFYPAFETIPQESLEEALKACFTFISCGEEDVNTGKRQPKLMDWEQDFRHIVPAVNRVLGQEIRAMPYLHWWTFIGAYNEIGDCLFAQIVSIRSKKAQGKRLEKHEQEWYRKNRALIDFKQVYTENEKDMLAALGIK